MVLGNQFHNHMIFINLYTIMIPHTLQESMFHDPSCTVLHMDDPIFGMSAFSSQIEWISGIIPMCEYNTPLL